MVGFWGEWENRLLPYIPPHYFILTVIKGSGSALAPTVYVVWGQACSLLLDPTCVFQIKRLPAPPQVSPSAPLTPNTLTMTLFI